MIMTETEREPYGWYIVQENSKGVRTLITISYAEESQVRDLCKRYAGQRGQGSTVMAINRASGTTKYEFRGTAGQ